ncbi:MAG: hypothetical protein U9Q89_05565 [Thermodesulfobacteriota bacterium]|nr:hypothetical protein [Thermodesulfobacteriota bacterium]
MNLRLIMGAAQCLVDGQCNTTRYVEEQSWQVVAIQKAMKRLQSGEAKFADRQAGKEG